MKKSELKAFIKEEILSVLEEDTQQDIKDTEELTKAIQNLKKAKEEAGLTEEDDDSIDDEELTKKAPSGDVKLQKKATKQDLIIKNYQDQQKELKKHLKDYKEAKGEEEKQAALKKMKDISQSAEYLDAKAKYEKLKQVKV